MMTFAPSRHSLAAGIAGIFAVVGTALSPAPGWATTAHDNEVFIALNGVEDANFTVTGHDITNKQPFNGATATVPKTGEIKIVVDAGRKNSESVADWFRTEVGAGQAVACDSKDKMPQSLNFAVKGTLSMTVQGNTIVCDDVILAQGHFGANNNWWVGGPKMTGVTVSITGLAMQSCRSSKGLLPKQMTFAPQTPCINHFNASSLN